MTTTLKAIVRKPRTDGLYAVYIRIVHNRKPGYIKTNKIVDADHISKDNEPTDPVVNEYCSMLVRQYTDRLNRANTTLWSVSEIIEYLLKTDEEVCFSDYSRMFIRQMRLDGHERIISSFGVEWLSKRKDMREDSAIAVFWTFGMAVGIIFSFLAPGFTPDLSAFLFGNILTITPTDILLLAILSVLLTLFFTLFLNPIICIAFDREFARSQRIPVALFEYILMMFIALTIVSCLRMVGIVLAISLLTLPQMTANLFTHSFTYLHRYPH